MGTVLLPKLGIIGGMAIAIMGTLIVVIGSVSFLLFKIFNETHEEEEA